MEATLSTYSYISKSRAYGGDYKVEGQGDHFPQDTRAKVGDYTITAKNWKGIRTYIGATQDGRRIFEGCYIERREWSNENGRTYAYSINFDKVAGQYISEELADAVVKFLQEVW